MDRDFWMGALALAIVGGLWLLGIGYICAVTWMYGAYATPELERLTMWILNF